MTKHQAPEVTSEDDPHCLCCCRRKSQHLAKDLQCPETAYFVENTRATQPLSLTVDEILVVARLRGLLAKATPLPWVRANLANITTKFTQVAPNITSQHTAYRSTDDVLCTEAVNALPALLDRLQSLSLPVDIDRSGLAQEVDDISYAGVGP